MLDIQNLSKTFNPGTVNEKKSLSSLSLHLDEGDFVTIVGSNGAGKSTLFNAIAGSFYADEGSISLAGKDSKPLALARSSRSICRSMLWMIFTLSNDFLATVFTRNSSGRSISFSTQ